MIRVNLLPLEYRKVERTPVMRFVAIILGVVISASAIAAFLYVHFGMLVKVVSEHEKLEQTYYTKKSAADRSIALQREANEYRKRRQTIEQAGSGRILWSRKIDQLADVIHNKGDSKRHLVWLTALRTLGGNKESPGGIYFTGNSGGGEIHRFSDFHLDVKRSEFFEDFAIIDNPEGTVVTFGDDRVPDSAWRFDFNMMLKPTGGKKGK